VSQVQQSSARADSSPLVQRAKNVFRFLAEVKKLSSPTVKDIDNYDQVIWLSDIPREENCFTKAWEVIDQPSEQIKDAWVEIEKPKTSAPPELPDGLDLFVNEREWRDSSTEHPSLLEVSRELLIRHFLPDEETDPEIQSITIDENEDIFELYVEYVDGPWKVWANQSKDSDAPEVPFPLPPDALLPWLDSKHLRDFTLAEPPLLDEISVEVDTKFEEAKRKLEADWNSYLESDWYAWAAEDRRLQRIQRIYNQLYSAYQQHQKLGEQYEIVLALGLLSWRGPKSSNVRRHILTAEASIQFDSRRGIITIVPPPNGTSLTIEDDMLHTEERPQLAEKCFLDNQAKESGDLFWDQAVLCDLCKSFVNSIQYDDGTGIKSSGQFELRLEKVSKPSEHPHIDLAPAIVLRKRSQRGFIRLLEEIENNIEIEGTVPEGIFNIITEPEVHNPSKEELGDENESPVLGHDTETYFPLPANKEQMQIARYLTEGEGVRVQGPPGTGKSHTITNLICHLLANGKRILVTSETERALRSLRSKFVGSAEPLSNLAVILLGNDATSMQELESSVLAINRCKETWRARESEETVQTLQQQLIDVRKRKRSAEDELRSIRESDVYKHHLKFGKYSGTLQEIAVQINLEQKDYSWFVDLPTEEDINKHIFADDPERFVRKWFEWNLNSQIDTDVTLYALSALPSDAEFSERVRKCNQLSTRVAELEKVSQAELLDAFNNVDSAQLHDVQQGVNLILAGLRNLKQGIHSWAFEAAKEIVAEQDRSWKELFHISRSELDKCSAIVNQVSELEVEGVEEAAIRRTIASVNVVMSHFKMKGKGKKVKWSLFQPKEVKQALSEVSKITIDGRSLTSLELLEQLSNWLVVTDSLNTLQKNWVGIYPVPPTSKIMLAAKFEDFMEPLETAIGLHEVVQSTQSKIDSIAKFSAPRWHSIDELEEFSNSLERFFISKDLENESSFFNKCLHEVSCVLKDDEGLREEVEAAVKDRDPGRYKLALEGVREANSLNQDQAEVLAQARKFRSSFPSTFRAFASDPASDVWIDRLRSLQRAVQWKLADAWLLRVCDPRATINLNSDIENYSHRERDILGQIAKEKAWQHCMTRLTEKQRQALVAWLQAIDRVGKGTGRHAEKHRRVARQKLVECQSAIPAWVMPLHRVVETVDAKANLFDVAIIDEASQSGSEALILNYIAKKVVVVGDDKQIRPTSIINQDDVEHLRQRYLSDVPHSETFDIKSSFFSQAEVRFSKHVTLKEHFRCMPEIIQFSNNHFYQSSPLIPLKQFGGDRLQPVLPIYVEGGFRKGSTGKVVNEPEAQHLAEFVAECCSDPRYDGKTMGVITLLGHQQGALIQDLLMREIESEEAEERNLMVGSAYTFQGDERDVIFMSMVDAPENGRRCRAVVSAVKEREFNVAASRAREQMILFHSATLNDLKENCLQHKLLSHCLNPEVKQIPLLDISLDDLRTIARDTERTRGNQPSPFDSWFEVDVYLEIVNRGYKVIPQYIVNPYEQSYRIDLVVEGLNGRLAVECDGDAYHTGLEQETKDLARQRELERCGWEFWRVRGGAYYRNPSSAMSSLWSKLERLSIYPEGYKPEENNMETSSFLSSPEISEFGQEVQSNLVEEGADKISINGSRRKPSQRLKAEDLSPKAIQTALLEILKERPNNSIALKAVASAVCKHVNVVTRGAPRRELDKRISRSIGVLKRQGKVEQYKSKNLRIRLV
jgi:very-short-patch-repair endonuclease